MSAIPSDVQVTRHFSLIFETPDASADASHGVFCDWISIYQSHGQGLPLVNDGCVVRYDSEGELECLTLKKSRFQGSHSTAVHVRCDGETVWFEGNVSRFGRPDNLFGFTFQQCIQRINSIISNLGLPPFTVGEKMWVKTHDGDRPAYTGARITRLDLTQNFCAGSHADAQAFMRFLASQQASRVKTGTYGEGETVDFGRGSRRVYSKAYLKGPELLKHLASASDPLYSSDLANWCYSVGLVRFETTYKSTFLIDNQLNFLGGFDMSVIAADFDKRKSVFTRASCDVEDLASLPKATLAVYRMWQAGDDLTDKYSKAQFYKHRAKLLPFGVDIAIKSNIAQFQPKVRVIKLGPVKMPDFYQLPSVDTIALAA